MTSWLNLEGKTAVVTGGASGIGKTVAQSFLDNGANVVVCDMNPDEPEFELGGSRGKLLYVVTDVTKAESVTAMVEKAKAAFGKLDILVNNAGINIPCLLVDPKDPHGKYELSERVYDKVTSVNIKGVYLMAQALGHEFVRNGAGVIINMSSESGLEGSEGQSIYAATKNAVNSFTRSWSKELGRYNVRVVGVAPGILEATGLRTLAYEEALSYTRGITVEDLRKGYKNTKTTPLGRSGKLTEVANLVLFLASDRASYIHGVTYNVAAWQDERLMPFCRNPPSLPILYVFRDALSGRVHLFSFSGKLKNLPDCANRDKMERQSPDAPQGLVWNGTQIKRRKRKR